MRSLAALAAALLLAAPTSLRGQSTHLLVISGLSGEPRLAVAFHEWSTTLLDAARERWGLPEANVVYLAEKVERDPARISARATRENVEAAIEKIAAQAAADDVIFIVLIGHGTDRDGVSRFNLPGPDMSAEDFARALEAYSTQRLVFVNSASASGEFIQALSGENRVIITATKSGFERNETVFANYFVEAFAGAGADVDKDQRVSALEAFDYARREVARTYEVDGRLLTEHALLDDDGDGVGSGEPSATSGDGGLARRLFLAAAPAGPLSEAIAADPELAALHQEKRSLEERVATLRQMKEGMDPEVYERELEALLVELALKTRAIREREGKTR